MAAPSSTLFEKTSDNCYVALTPSPLSIPTILDRVRSPKAGALVLFAGTTRDNFNNAPVASLEYSAYAPRALQTMLDICTTVATTHALTGIAMVHRLGVVPIGEESILIAVASAHRQAAWRAGEEALEECKRKVEVWKKEVFAGDAGAVWRANRDGEAGVRIDGKAGGESEDIPVEQVGQKPKEKTVEEGGGEALDLHFHGVSQGQVRPFRNLLEKGHGPVVHHRG